MLELAAVLHVASALRLAGADDVAEELAVDELGQQELVDLGAGAGGEDQPLEP
jgi:hypothetical protein